MLKSKKYFLLLLCIPAYACYLYTLHVFTGSAVRWSDLIGASAFVSAAAVFFAFKDKKIKLPLFICLQAAHIILPLLIEKEQAARQESLLIYALYFLPALLLIEAAADTQALAEKKTKRKKAEEDSRIPMMKYVFWGYLTVAVIVFFAALRGKPQAAFNGTGACLMLFFGFFVFCCLRISAESRNVRKICFPLMISLSAVAFLNGAAYILRFHSYKGDSLLFTFPLFLAAVLFFHAFPAAKTAVFRSLF